MRNVLRVFLLVIGIVVLLSGLLFFLQGTGIFPYPKTSFMINEKIWVLRGALLFILGIFLLIIRRALRRR
ncbi:MAG: hypothetical protein U7M05_01025 [Candidatus Igneacidithiobacillus chanchocoensis]